MSCRYKISELSNSLENRFHSSRIRKMCFRRSGHCGSGLGHKLCKCFQRLTAAPGCPPPGDPGSQPLGCGNPHRAARVEKSSPLATERTKWMWRNQVPSKLRTRFKYKSHRDQWYATNRNIIVSLGRILGLHADVVFEFLYLLTLQNFARVLNPRGNSWNLCRVPLSNVSVCDYYAGIFDCDGNVRNPFHPDVLEQLLAMMQQLLKQDNSSCSGSGGPVDVLLPVKESRPVRLAKRIARRAGIGPDSLARANGIRRRYQLGERYELGGCHEPVAPHTWQQSCARHFAKLWHPKGDRDASEPHEVHALDWAAVEDNYNYSNNNNNGEEEAADDDDDHQELSKPEVHIRDRLYEMLYHNLAKARGRELKRLLLNVKQQTGLRSELTEMLDAVRQLDLKLALRGEQQHLRNVSHRLSRDYNTLTANFRPAVTPKGCRYKVNAPRIPEHHHVDGGEPRPSRYYYAAQVPVLLHEPFNASMSRTWIRRHPDALRLNERGQIVRQAVPRYKRQSVETRLAEARQRYSIHSVYSGHDASSPKEPARPKQAEQPSREQVEQPKLPEQLEPAVRSVRNSAVSRMSRVSASPFSSGALSMRSLNFSVKS